MGSQPLQAGKKRESVSLLCPSEVMTILIHFQQSHYRTFKSYYTENSKIQLSDKFPPYHKITQKYKKQLMHLSDKLRLRKRAVIDLLENISQIEHSRHRNPTNFVVHLIAGLIAYSHQDKKPDLHLDAHVLLAA